MARPDKGGYADPRYHTEQTLILSDNLSVVGTAASATNIARYTALTNIRALAANVQLATGGTAAGPVVTLNKSAAGTGALAAFGTVSFGTSADDTVSDITLTETDIAAGDDIVLTTGAGTAASTPVATFNLAYVEDFVSD